MKKLLLVTTALAGTSLLAAPASAVDLAAEFQDGASPVVQRQPAFAVRLAGFVRVEGTWVDQDKEDVQMRPSFRLRDSVGLAVIGTATADNGLSYGFNLDVDQIRGELHLANRFGRLTLGNTFTATDSLDVGGSSVQVGRGGVYSGGQTLLRIPAGGLAGVSLTRPQGIPGIPMQFDGGPTIRYSTPNYGGLTIAVSYTNETTFDKGGSEIDGDSVGSGVTTAGGQNLKMNPLGQRWHAEDVFSIAGQYTSSYGNYTTVVYAGYEAGNRTLKDCTPAICGGLVWGQHGGHHDVELISFGARVSGMGAGFGIGYGERHADTNFPAGADDDAQWYDIGLSFSSGPWAISGVYAHLERDSATAIALPRQEWDLWSISSSYRLAPGLSIDGGVTIADLSDVSPIPVFGDSDFTSFTIGTTARF